MYHFHMGFVRKIPVVRMEFAKRFSIPIIHPTSARVTVVTMVLIVSLMMENARVIVHQNPSVNQITDE